MKYSINEAFKDLRNTKQTLKESVDYDVITFRDFKKIFLDYFYPNNKICIKEIPDNTNPNVSKTFTYEEIKNGEIEKYIEANPEDNDWISNINDMEIESFSIYDNTLVVALVW